MASPQHIVQYFDVIRYIETATIKMGISTAHFLSQLIIIAIVVGKYALFEHAQ
eukprot:CAMPEP_0202729070 /NCGR_PEP_ID=MMETSP1385-20130828/185945_1 /ASSEMBLY_ACC=CAM_ASM_000861 /TAXON_ID=933848 /ORGANISM="Elphidium margaritaceum" /LENGTH=52 /DNA_ID=CAMNT_0049395327 /DNA_START=195 /DNA_END=353 /DNA_ORIENTATION=+